MTFLETIGFIIALFALMIGYIKKSMDDKKRRANPEEYDRLEMEKAERLKDFLKSVNLDMQEQPKPKKTAKVSTSVSSHKKYAPARQPHLEKKLSEAKPLSSIESTLLESKIEKHKYSSPIGNHYVISHKDAYSLVKGAVSNRALQTLSRVKSKKDMVILHELISAPRALRKL